MKHVKFELLSDFVACGINTENNFLTSEAFISGAVIRAAFAKDIYLDCDIENRDYFIELKDSPKCSDCPKRAVCASFSEMSFSFFYPENTIPAPMTTRRCKLYPKQHGIKDIMLGTDAKNLCCSDCTAEGTGRMDDAKGYINTITNKPFAVKRSHSIHTAVNYTTRTVKDSSLFSVNAIESGQIFEGCIDDRGSGLIREGKVIYAGKYSSNGFGKLRIISVEDEPLKPDAQALGERIAEFTRLFKHFCPDRFRDGRLYAPILLRAPARPDIQTDTQPLSTDAYKQLWNGLLFRNEGAVFEIENVFARTRLYRGFDSAKRWGMWLKEPTVEVLAGSSVLVSFDKSCLDSAIAALLDLIDNGIGRADFEAGRRDNLNGYGAVEVCAPLHLLRGKEY